MDMSLGWREVDWPLRAPLTTGASATRREVLELRLASPRGEGWGEAAPLPGLHREGRSEVVAALPALAAILASLALEDPFPRLLRRLEEAMRRAELPPSLVWAAGWALGEMVGWAETLPRTAPDSAGLLAGDPEEWAALAQDQPGTACWKVKVGRHAWERETRGLLALRRARPAAALRLDANRAFALEEGLAFQRACPGLAPDWIEEPLAATADLARWRRAGGWPLALDESLGAAELDGGEERAAAAWVLKPQRLGLAAVLDRLAAAPEGRPACIISSCFESPLGLAALSRLAALAPGGPAPGLGTAAWLGDPPRLGDWHDVGRPA
jgi:O-succinylbenzoate synthase